MPLSSPGDLPNPGIESGSLALQADSLSSEPSGKPNITNRSQKLSIPLHSAMLTFFHFYLCLCVLSCFSHVQICDLMDCSPPASSTLQARNRGSGLPCPPPGDPPDPRIKLTSLTSPALAGGFFTTSTTWQAPFLCTQPPRNKHEIFKCLLYNFIYNESAKEIKPYIELKEIDFVEVKSRSSIAVCVKSFCVK